MIETLLRSLLFALGAALPVMAFADGPVIEGASARFDCRIQEGKNQLDILFRDDRSPRQQILFSSKYFFSAQLNLDYLKCQRVLAMAEAYDVAISVDSRSGAIAARLSASQPGNVLRAQPDLLSCEILPEGSDWPNTVTIQYGEHVIYRDYSITGLNSWRSWTQSCADAKAVAKSTGSIVLVDLVSWTFTAETR